MVMEGRRGVTILETVIALLIFSIAALTILRSGGSIHERSYSNEFHAMAAIRARSLASIARALDFDVVRAVAGGAAATYSVPLDLEKFFEPGQIDFVLKPPAGRNPLFEQKLADFTHEVRIRVPRPEFIELDVIVRWKIPGEKRADPHEYRLITAWHRPTATFNGGTAP